MGYQVLRLLMRRRGFMGEDLRYEISDFSCKEAGGAVTWGYLD
jgi:hypothetical protein